MSLYISKFWSRARFLLLILFIFNSTHILSSPVIGDNLTQSLLLFVTDIYHNYSEENFEYIYENLYPSIKEIITEKEYRQFQSENFNRYNLKIEKIKIDESIQEINLPDYFSTIVDDKIEVYEVPIKYEMVFSIGRSEQWQEIEKYVLVGIEDGQIYLLWNPSLINN